MKEHLETLSRRLFRKHQNQIKLVAVRTAEIMPQYPDGIQALLAIYKKIFTLLTMLTMVRK